MSTAEVVISNSRKVAIGQICRTIYPSGLKEVFIKDDRAQSSSSSQKQTVKKATTSAPAKKKVSESVKKTEISDKGKAKRNKTPAAPVEVEDLVIDLGEPIEISSGTDCDDEIPQLELKNVERTIEQPSVLKEKPPVEKEIAEDTSQSKEMVESSENVETNADKNVAEKAPEEETLTKEEQQTDADLQQKETSHKTEVVLEQTERNLPEAEEVLTQEKSTVDDNMEKNNTAEGEQPQEEAVLLKTESTLPQEEASSKEGPLPQEEKSTLPKPESVVTQSETKMDTSPIPKAEKVTTEAPKKEGKTIY